MLAQLREITPQIEATGTQLIAVSVKAAYQAQHLLDQGMPFPLLIDPDDTVRTALNIERMSMGRLLAPSGAMAYGKSLKHAKNFAVRPSEATQRPGCVLLDAEQNVVWQHIGNALGDYPSTDEILRAVESHTSGT